MYAIKISAYPLMRYVLSLTGVKAKSFIVVIPSCNLLL